MDGGTRLLHDARQLIERGWTRHADARAADHSPVHPWDDRATKLVAPRRPRRHRRAHRRHPGRARRDQRTRPLPHHARRHPGERPLERWNDGPPRTGKTCSPPSTTPPPSARNDRTIARVRRSA